MDKIQKAHWPIFSQIFLQYTLSLMFLQNMNSKFYLQEYHRQQILKLESTWTFPLQNEILFLAGRKNFILQFVLWYSYIMVFSWDWNEIGNITIYCTQQGCVLVTLM